MCEENLENEINSLKQINEINNEIIQLNILRENNLNKNKLNLNNKTELKSDLKKTTTFVKKLRLITTDGILQCLRDIKTLNLKLYISEIINSLNEINCKPNDLSNIIKLCNELHLIYDDFTIPLINKIKESLLSQDEEIQKRRRIQIRMIIEFYQIGLFNDDSFFPILLKDITGKTFPKYIYLFIYLFIIILIYFLVNKLIFLV